MRILLFLSLLLTGMVTLHSCYYDKEDLLYGTKDAPCTDTAASVSYTQKIVPLFQQYCYSCHSGGFPSGGISMGTYAADKAIGQNGKLYGSVNHSAGYSPMPKGAPKMTSCQVAAIKKWIDTGMPNN
ncbi:MAG: cytochrome c [Chitinophagaceae bacterium]